MILLSVVADEEAGKFPSAVDYLAKPVSERVQLPHVGRVIVLDIRMPQTDGIAARQALRADDQTRRVPVIRMTGYAGTLEENRSTTAELDAPLILTKPFAAEQLVTALRRLSPGETRHEQHRIVVADGDPYIRRLVAFTLKKRGCEILEAGDGVTALALVRQEKPDLVVLDVLIPTMNGLDVTRALAQDPATSNIPVLILSASAQQSEIEAGLASGATAYLIKPFEPKVLGERVAEILTQKGIVQ